MPDEALCDRSRRTEAVRAHACIEVLGDPRAAAEDRYVALGELLAAAKVLALPRPGYRAAAAAADPDPWTTW